MRAPLACLWWCSCCVRGAPTGAAQPALRCTAPDEVTRFKVALPHTACAIRRGTALVIVAIGSSSTQGVGASDQAHTYPTLLAEALRHRWPQLAVTVVNKGVGGDRAKQMLAKSSGSGKCRKYVSLDCWHDGTLHFCVTFCPPPSVQEVRVWPYRTVAVTGTNMATTSFPLVRS